MYLMQYDNKDESTLITDAIVLCQHANTGIYKMYKIR